MIFNIVFGIWVFLFLFCFIGFGFTQNDDEKEFLSRTGKLSFCVITIMAIISKFV